MMALNNNQTNKVAALVLLILVLIYLVISQFISQPKSGLILVPYWLFKYHDSGVTYRVASIRNAVINYAETERYVQYCIWIQSLMYNDCVCINKETQVSFFISGLYWAIAPLKESWSTDFNGCMLPVYTYNLYIKAKLMYMYI